MLASFQSISLSLSLCRSRYFNVLFLSPTRYNTHNNGSFLEQMEIFQLRRVQYSHWIYNTFRCGVCVCESKLNRSERVTIVFTFIYDKVCVCPNACYLLFGRERENGKTRCPRASVSKSLYCLARWQGWFVPMIATIFSSTLRMELMRVFFGSSYGYDIVNRNEFTINL